MSERTHRRTPPKERFSPNEDELDLDKAAEALAAEPAGGEHGHRQMTLFHHGPMTIALFVFEESGARLPDHVVDGPVIIQSLAGRIRVNGADGHHELPAGRLLRLAPGVRHDVEALEPSRMLLTVCLEGPESHR